MIREVVGSLRKVADFVVVDSPPCLHDAEAFLLGSFVDGIIYVVRRRPQDARAQREIRAQLDRLGTRVLGVVFNEG
jgi:Mrp family chromosome partitioning ATPase